MLGGDDTRFERLSPCQRQCLRLVYDRKKSGQIATALGLSVGTIHGYCNDAVRTLGARDRIDAAEQFVAWEKSNESDPLEVQLHNAGVAPAEPVAPIEAIGTAEPGWRRLLPMRLEGSYDNDLGVLARLLWIPLIAVVLAIGFAAIADTVRVASDLVAGARRG